MSEQQQPEISALQQKVAEYWKNYKNSNINHALINFEYLEQGHFSISREQEDYLDNYLTNLTKEQLIALKEEKCLTFLNSLPAAYMFYMIHQMNRVHAEYVSTLIANTNRLKDKDEAYGYFYTRNMVYEKMQILSRIFAADRINKLIQCLGD